MTTDIRWIQRLDNFDRAARLLEEACGRGIDALSALEKEGAVHRFEMTFELAWKTMRDYLDEQGVAVRPVAPRTVIKEAFAAGIVEDGQLWIDMMLHRNLLAHRYDLATFETVLAAVVERYLGALLALRDFFQERKARP